MKKEHIKEKINIAQLIKDCPKGMELDCTICDNVCLDEVTPNMIKCFVKNDVYNTIYFHHDGTYLPNPNAKCVIFPKGKTTWEGFQRPFKDGDVAVTEKGHIHLLRTKDSSYCAYRGDWQGLPKFDSTITTGVKIIRFATEEEKQKLFKAIKDNGYKWNPESKTLEKLPKFKVGDEISKRNSISNSWIVCSVSSEYYGLKLPNGSENIGVLPIEEQDDWELVPDKFDINTLKPFDKVLVRDNNAQKWTADLFSLFDKSLIYPYSCVGHYTNQCIPYEGNEHLLGTSNDCDDYYKTWEE